MLIHIRLQYFIPKDIAFKIEPGDKGAFGVDIGTLLAYHDISIFFDQETEKEVLGG